MKKIISATNAPAAIGPYSQAIDCGNFLVTSGQVPFDPATGEFVPGGITEQTRQVLTNIKAILTEAGLTMDNVVKTTVFLQNRGDFAAMNAVYAEFFTEGQYPARKQIPKKGSARRALPFLHLHCFFEYLANILVNSCRQSVENAGFSVFYVLYCMYHLTALRAFPYRRPTLFRKAAVI